MSILTTSRTGSRVLGPRMADASPGLALDGVRKEYGTVTALDRVDLSLDGPAIIGVAGPNGSGKTTLIHAVLGLVSPTAGTVRVDGTRPAGFDAADRTRIGYMPQHAAVYEDLTVRENVAFFASIYGVDDPDAAVDRALEFVDLADRADGRIGALSGGMVRRTSLACAIVHEPDLLFLDEPTVGLDPTLRAAMWDGFRERRDQGALVVVSTHYLEEAKGCDAVCFLRDGRVLALDSPGRFLERTGASDLEGAFLALLERDDAAGTTGGEEASGAGTTPGGDST